MITQLRKHHIPFILTALLSLGIIVSLTHCRTPQGGITGSWKCLSHSNPDPFFKKSLEGKECLVSVVFEKDGTFTWRDGTDPVVTGYWCVEGPGIIMEIKGEKPVPVEHHFNEGKLILQTNDGFIFVLERKE